ncbi:MAG: divergent polysaccharide deacetylase family protein [Pseudomonadota bacterium]
MTRSIFLLLAIIVASPTLAETPPRIAIIIDDLGYDHELGLRAIALPAQLTVAILPHTPRARSLAEAARASGKEVIVHLPLEAMNPRGPFEPERLTLAMTEPEVDAVLQRALAAVPHAVGVNNHRGSLLTRQPLHMQWLMNRIGSTGDLFFVDSFTTHHSVAMDAAEKAGVPAVRRDVFLDHSRDPSQMRQQLERLKRRASSEGQAVAIGHPYPETMALLEEVLPELKAEGFELVPVSQLVKTGTPAALAASGL